MSVLKMEDLKVLELNSEIQSLINEFKFFDSKKDLVVDAMKNLFFVSMNEAN